VNKATIIEALRVFVNQRPGLEYGNYGEWKAYSAEVRSIGKDLREARQLLRAVELRDTITADDIVAATSAYSGRLSIIERNGKVAIAYCTGQYWPTEYRRAVCAVLSSCLLAYWRYHAMPAPVGQITKTAGTGAFAHDYTTDVYPMQGRKVSAGDYLRATARNEFGRGIASRWFA
jgi:hypothetical protein